MVRWRLQIEMPAGLASLLLLALAPLACPGQDVGIRDYLVGDAAMRLLERASRHASDKEFDKAEAIYRQLLLDYPGKLVEVSEGRYVNTRRLCTRRLAEMPPEAFPRRKAASTLLGERFAAAMHNGDERRLADFAQDFSRTPFGSRAMDRLAEIDLERGQFGRALATWQDLLDLGPHGELPVPWVLTKMAFAYHELGEASAVHGVLAQLNEKHPDAKGVVAGKEVRLAEFVEGLLAAPANRPGNAEWLTWGGQPSRCGTGPKWLGLGKRLWECDCPRPQTIADGNTVYVLGDGVVAARDLLTGRLRWKRELGKPAQNGYVPAVPTLADRLLLLPDPATPSTVLAIEVSSGKLTGKFEAAGLADGSWTVDASPVVEDGILYFSALQVGGGKAACWLRATELATQRPLWQVNVCQVAEKEPPPGPATPVAVFGGRVFLCPGLGLVAAVDATTGEHLWATAYPRHKAGPAAASVPPPIVSEGKVVVAPRDAEHLYCLDPSDGAVLWKQPRGAASVVPAGNGAVLLVGESISSIDVRQGTTRWQHATQQQHPPTAVWVAEATVLLPSASGLAMLDGNRGRLLAPVAWPPGSQPTCVGTSGPVVFLSDDRTLRAFANCVPEEKP